MTDKERYDKNSMKIEEQFNAIAKEYDGNRRKFIPCFDDYYDQTTRLITANMKAPERILDLGAGTGLLSYFWYRCFPQSEYVLVDIADEMLKIAQKRFAGIDRVSYTVKDYTKALPEQDFDCIISALSIHHLEQDQKAELFARIYEKLPPNGVFVNYDQFCADDEKLNAWINDYWEDQLYHSGLTPKDLERWQERRKLDRECSVETQVRMLRESGFDHVACVYSNQKFAVVVAIK